MAYKTGYDPGLHREDISRLQLRVPKRIVDAIDVFGIPEGFRSRNAAIVHLIEQGLAETEKASGNSLAATPPDASQK
ncbi:hypothetical protein IFJ82_09550 [Novacetimonas hansenii]|uniref:hypothetical protein n=1 Tax=Novacetimonas hansenii TaxID=436 RepID=UPI001783D377|nr:hypothetical protein [Novacetimonas hansenii]QOF94196.1 hypothetical protein IFJ82_09550 [Novacetimonas hansenii]